eukprot:15193892-Alexandrium_andersonii.AAC.1
MERSHFGVMRSGRPTGTPGRLGPPRGPLQLVNGSQAAASPAGNLMAKALSRHPPTGLRPRGGSKAT